LKTFSHHVGLVNETDDTHLSWHLGKILNAETGLFRAEELFDQLHADAFVAQ